MAEEQREVETWQGEAQGGLGRINEAMKRGRDRAPDERRPTISARIAALEQRSR